LATIRIIVEVLNGAGSREGGEREVVIPDVVMDLAGLIERAIAAAVDEIEYLKLKGNR
jgi:hypothetical protein